MNRKNQIKLIIKNAQKNKQYLSKIKNNSKDDLWSRIKPMFEFIKYYFAFIRSVKFVTLFGISLIAVTLMYINSLILYSYENLFFISFAFFENNNPSMRTWDSLIGIVYIITHMSKGNFLLLLSTVLVSTFPLAAIRYISFLKNKHEFNTMLTISSAILICMCSLLIFIALMEVFNLSDHFIYMLRNMYADNHPNYCKIVLYEKSNKNSFIITEEKSVPYKLIFTESSILYYKPNEPIATWKAFESSDIDTMKVFCNNLKQEEQ